ncbi:MAG: hypothetical protein V1721_05230 [Pseudomonadota bacterium]
MQKDVKAVSRKAKYPLLKALQAMANGFAEGVFAIVSATWDRIYGSIKRVIVRFIKGAPNLFVFILVMWAIYFFVKIVLITSLVL